MKFDKNELICFWKTTDKYGAFSNWYLCDFVCPIHNGEEFTFHSGEQLFMYEKAILFNDIEIANKILSIKLNKTDDNKIIKQLGREISNFDEKIWNRESKDRIICGILEKFVQNDNLCDLLLCTGNKHIAEASPIDCIWGCGLPETDEKIYDTSNWKGENRLGNMLMEIRDAINKLNINK